MAAPEYPNDFMEYAKPGAKHLIIGVFKEPTTLMLPSVMSNEFHFVGSRAYTSADIHELIDNLAVGRIPVDKIVSHVLALEDANEAFECACDHSKAMRVVLNME